MTAAGILTRPLRRKTLPTFTLLAAAAWPVVATEISGVLPAALDQPRINVIIRPTASTDPYIYEDVFGDMGFNVDPYLDTGASGVLISGDAAAALQRPPSGPAGLPGQLYNNKPVYFEDIGVAGADRFTVSQGLHISMAPYHPNTDAQVELSTSAYNSQNSFAGVDLGYYNQKFGNIRAQISAPSDPQNPSAVDGINVFGMPVMKGKNVVMDFRALNTLQFETMRTYVYDPNTPFKPATNATDPGIPATTRTIKLSYGSFNQFTRSGTLDAGNNVVPLTGQDLLNNQPTLDHNPFIGPNPVSPAGDTTPPVKLSFQANPDDAATLRTTTGSFLFDTGAAASMISTGLAAQLAVRYRPGTETTDDPKLETYDPAHPQNTGTLINDQFQVAIGGVGGTKTVAGFYLKSLLVRTMEGNAANDNDPKHFKFLDAPVLINDITLSPTLTLDGIFGMNFLLGTALIENVDIGGGIKFPMPVALAPGAFDWAVFDEPNGLLKLRTRIPGDANRDGVVDFNDLVALAQNYDTGGTPEDYYGGGDFNGDDVVDFQDLVALAQHYGLTDVLDGDRIDLPAVPFDLGFGANASGVPEPTGLAALGLGALALTHRRRRTPRA